MMSTQFLYAWVAISLVTAMATCRASRIWVNRSMYPVINKINGATRISSSKIAPRTYRLFVFFIVALLKLLIVSSYLALYGLRPLTP